MAISKIDDAIAAIARGEIVVVVDDRDRENEGDLVIASEAITSQSIAFMMNYARGLICRCHHRTLCRRWGHGWSQVRHLCANSTRTDA